jgi:hypothetical protein
MKFIDLKKFERIAFDRDRDYQVQLFLRFRMFIFLLLSIFVAYAVYEMIWKRRKWPPGPMPLPLIGNVHQLDMRKPDVSLMKFKKQYGPIFTIFIPKPAVIVADYEVCISFLGDSKILKLSKYNRFFDEFRYFFISVN